jgi:hypothetical protein
MTTRQMDRSRRKLSRSYDLLAQERLDAHESGLHGLQGGRRQLAYLLQRQFLSHYFSAAPRWRMLIRRFGGRRTLPDFCVIGPAKSGSSDLAVSVMLHPNVMTPFIKELWDTDPQAWRIAYPTEREVQRHARRHGTALSPFLSPCLHCFDIAYNLSQLARGTKVVINLRNPVARAFSDWKWTLLQTDRRQAQQLPFLATFPAYVAKALETFPAFALPTANVLQEGIYVKAVQHWLQCFGSKNVMVLNVADYFADRNAYLRKVQEFVGLPYVATPEFKSRVNENPVMTEPADPQTLERLRLFYRPYNEQLWSVLGQQFAW